MKNLIEVVNEGRYDAEYRVSIIGVEDMDGLPLSATILVNKSDRRAFEQWLEEQQDDIFAHAEGGSVEY